MATQLDREDATVRTYLNRLVTHATNAYSVCSLFLAVLALLPIWFGLNTLWLSAAAAVFSLLPASYRTWREAVTALPPPAALIVECKTSVVDLPIDDRVPKSRGKVDIRLAITNPTDEPVYLTGVELVSWSCPAGLVEGTPVVKLYGQRERYGWGELLYPVRFDPKSRREDIVVFASIEPSSGEDIAFAASLRKAEAIGISFRILTENAARVRHSLVVDDQVPLSLYKENAIRTWRAKGHSDLLSAIGHPI